MINGKYYYIYIILQIFIESLLYESSAILSTVDDNWRYQRQEPWLWIACILVGKNVFHHGKIYK